MSATTQIRLKDGVSAHNAEAATSVAACTLGRPAVIQPKLNGVRLFAQVAEDDVHFATRTGNGHDGKLPRIAEELASAFPAGTVLDGELVSLGFENGMLAEDFNRVAAVIQSGPDRGRALSGGLSYVVFDALQIGGIDARHLPYEARRNLLAQQFARFDLETVVLITEEPATDEAHDRLLALGFEGSIIRNLASSYQSGKRGQGFYKVKVKDSIDATVIAFKPGEGSFKDLIGAIIFGQYEGDQLVEVGACSGMDLATRIAMTENPEDFYDKPIEVGFTERLTSGKLRHPRYLRMRPDKPAEETTLD